MAVTVKANISIQATQTGTNGIGQTKASPHVISVAQDLASGVIANTQDRVIATTLSLAGSAQTIDLAGSFVDDFGSTVTFANVTGVTIVNQATTTGKSITIGGGTNPWITWLKATGDGVVLGAGGTFHLSSPIDGYAVTASTGDILTIDPGASTLTVLVLIYGRSA